MKAKLTALISIMLVLSLTFFTNGCGDSREVENLSIFTILGVDWVNVNGVDMWQISARVMHSGGQTQGDKQAGVEGGTEEALWKGTGRTIQEAISNIVTRTPRSPFFAHISSYIFGERAAREKLEEWMEGNKYPEVRPHSYLMVTKGEAFNVLQAGPEISPTLSKEILEMNKQTIRQHGLSLDVTQAQFMSWLMSADREAVLPEIKIIYPDEKQGAEATGPDKSVAIEGLGVFRGTKLVGWLNREESLGSQLIMDNLSGGNIYLTVDVDGTLFTYLIQRSDRKIEASLADDKLSVKVTIETQGQVTDPQEETISPEEMSRLETAAGDKIRDIALKAIDKAKEYDSDFLGFTEKLHRTNPSAWKEIEPHWRESFQDADVDVEVKAKILNNGISGEKLKLKH